MDNLRFREFYRRRLPHFQIEGATYFITFRLANSLPAEALDGLIGVDAQQILQPLESSGLKWLEKLDDFLDKALGRDAFLKDPRVADVVAEAMRYRNGRVYDLVCFCIMPNHVHLVCTQLIKPDGKYFGLAEVLHSLKGYTARQANSILNRSGSFWQHESYDHVVRDEAELERIVKYVLYNPVKAGLVDDPSKWPWSYSKVEL